MKIPIIKVFVSVAQGTASAPGVPGVKILRFAQPPPPTKSEPGKSPVSLPGVNAALFAGGAGGIETVINNVHADVYAECPESKSFDLALIPEGQLEQWCRDRISEIRAAEVTPSS